jgi:GrpB-like predicted nucleotidyltransferase (UPF0157 family)
MASPTSEEYLAAVTIGEREPHDAPILLADYDPRWPQAYAALAERIRAALGEAIVTLEHVGSTSVPGLCAKPIIDVLLVVPDSTDEAAYVPALEARGFVLRIREPGWFEHRMLKAKDIDCNVHVFSEGCEEPARMLAFRDRLRSHEDDRRLYADSKRALAARTWRHVQHYADAKSEVVREILERCA